MRVQTVDYQLCSLELSLERKLNLNVIEMLESNCLAKGSK